MNEDKRESFKSLRLKHFSLLEEMDELKDHPASLIPNIKEQIEEWRQAGEYISEAGERDYLRSILSFWGSFVFEHSEPKEYPETGLYPLDIKIAQRAKVMRMSKRVVWYVMPAIAVLAGIASILALLFGEGILKETPTETPTVPSPTPTTAIIAVSPTSTSTDVCTPTLVPTPTNTQTNTPTSTNTPTPTHTSTPTSTPTNTPTPTATPMPPTDTPTPTATPTPTLLPPPILIEPENGAAFIGGPVILKWQWGKPLAQDELFALRVRREREREPCHHSQVQGLEYWGDLTYCSAGKHFWEVALLRQLCTDCPGEEMWLELSEPSEERWIYYAPGKEPWTWPAPDSGGELGPGRSPGDEDGDDNGGGPCPGCRP